MAAVDFSIFNKSFFKNSKLKIVWFDKKGTVKLKNNLMATITISTKGHHDHYQKYIVSILNKESKIDSHSFDFDVYLGKNNNDLNKQFQILGHCCNNGYAEWYIGKPDKSKVDGMAKEIAKYIQQYENL